MPQSGLTSKISRKTNIIVLPQNIRCITNKTGLLVIVLRTHDPAILLCSETWCNNNEKQRLRLTGYQLANNYCRRPYNHGAV